LATKTTPEGRITFSSVLNPLDYPDFLDIQLKSFKDFFQLETLPEHRQYDGLYRVFVRQDQTIFSSNGTTN
jgi:DNA-directed RNA polymerase subunit beta